MSAASLCPAVSISDVINKAGLYGKRITQSQANLFCSSMVKSDLTWLRPEEVMFEAKNILLVLILMRQYLLVFILMEQYFIGIDIDGTILCWYWC